MEKLSEREKEWLYYLFENDFLGREILIEQLNKDKENILNKE